MSSRTLIFICIFGVICAGILLGLNTHSSFTNSVPNNTASIDLGQVESNPERDYSSLLHHAKAAQRPTEDEQLKEILSLEDENERRRRLFEFLQEWASRDPAQAGTFVLNIEDEELRKQSMLRIMQTWVGKNTADALAWAKDASFGNAYEREVAMSMACTELAKSNPPEALRLALQYEFDQSDLGLLEGLTSRWAEMDLAGAQKWVLTLPECEKRDSLVESIALEMFDRSPDASCKFVCENLSPGEPLEKTVMALVSKLAFQDSQRAQKWIDSFPEGTLRDGANRRLRDYQKRQI